jgi:hypothetical protein
MRENQDSLLTTLKESDMAKFSFPKFGPGQCFVWIRGGRVRDRPAEGQTR